MTRGDITFRAPQTGNYAAIEGEDMFDVTAYLSPKDGCPVIEIDTQRNVGEIRVYINDGRIWKGDPEKGPSSTLRPNAARALKEYEEWTAEREELSERDGNMGDVSSSEWQGSDDTAFDLVHLMADVIRRSANYLKED